ncbi:MAG: ABC transporter permease [Deltaproteobacteria bacterium]
MIDAMLVFVAQTVTASVPIVLAAMGGTLSERAGVATLALEGYLLGGAFGAAVAALAWQSTAAALLAAALVGAALGALFAIATVRLRANAIVAGVAINLLAAAGTRVALKVLYDSASNSPPLLNRAARSGALARVAFLDAVTQPVAWLAPLCVLAVYFTLNRTVFGLRVRAAGENPEACRAQGVSVDRVRFTALVLGGAIAALGGAHLTLLQHEFVAFMSGGRGFLGLAAVILGGWRPGRAALAAVAIGMLTALEATLAGRVPFPSAVLQALPFVATLIAVVGVVGRTRPPRALSA